MDYRAIARAFLRKHPGFRVRFRQSYGGLYDERGVAHVPRPTGPVALKILFHEYGHHGLSGSGPGGWREELAVDDYALDQMRKFGVPVTPTVLRRIWRWHVEIMAKTLRQTGAPLSSIPQRYRDDVGYALRYGVRAWKRLLHRA